MTWTRHTALLFAGLFVVACGTTNAPTAQVSPAVSPIPSPVLQATPSPTVQPAPIGGSAKVTCSGGPGAAMAVVAGQFVYDVSDPVHPRLVCSTTTTYFHLLDGNAIAYTTVVAKKVVIVRRDLATGAESRIGNLPADPQGAKSWTSDGSLEVYSTYVPLANNRALVSVHLWTSGTDHVLYKIETGPGGLEGRWSPLPIVEISPDQTYIAINDFKFALYGNKVRIFSVADRRQLLVTGGSGTGGAWIANDRFVWGSGSPLMQWTPTGGAKVLRSEYWYGTTSSVEGGWMAATLLTDSSEPRVSIVPVGSGRTFKTGLGSAPTFVTPTKVWYAEEAKGAPGYDPTEPNGVIHSIDLASGLDQVVQFRAGEKPVGTLCCTTRV
jgi:hypothetical protein